MKKKTQAATYIKEMCAIDAAALNKPLQITPVGEVEGIDGRLFKIDGAAVLESLNASKLKIVLNVDHGETDKHGTEAAGWFDGFELRDDGIYAKLTLTKLGQKLLDDQSYKYLSPEFLTDEFRNVVALVGVGLVNQPNLLNQALNHTQQFKQEKQSTGEENMKDKQAKDKAYAQALEKENNTLKETIKTQAKLMHEQKVNNAIFEGKLLPAKKEFALTLDENALAAFLKMEAESSPKKEENGLNPDAHDADGSNPIFDQLGI